MNNTIEKKTKGKKYKQTKELVRLAINSGWTQTQIAKDCRVNQSVVSLWKSGKSKGREDQLQKLIAEFGNKLRRKTFKVYWDLNTEGEHSFFRVEGRVIMDHQFSGPRRNTSSGKVIKQYPKRRLIVHDQGNGQYLLLKQSRLGLTKNKDEIVECSVPAAGWVTEVINSAPMNKDELIKYMDTQYEKLLEKLPSDAVTLPYLIRQGLLYAGDTVDEVVDYPARS